MHIRVFGALWCGISGMSLIMYGVFETMCPTAAMDVLFLHNTHFYMHNKLTKTPLHCLGSQVSPILLYSALYDLVSKFVLQLLVLLTAWVLYCTCLYLFQL